MMITKVEKTILDRFRKLSVEKQEEVLTFLQLLEEDLSKNSTDDEIREAKRILEVAKQKALSNSSQSLQDLWTSFEDAKKAIAKEYEGEKD